jgi:hypothetical protein
LVAIDILTVIKVSFVNPLVREAGRFTSGLAGYLVITIFFLFRYGLIEVECGEGKVALAVLTRVFMPLRNRVMANVVGNLIKFKTLLLFGLYRDYYY